MEKTVQIEHLFQEFLRMLKEMKDKNTECLQLLKYVKLLIENEWVHVQVKLFTMFLWFKCCEFRLNIFWCTDKYLIYKEVLKNDFYCIKKKMCILLLCDPKFRYSVI